MSGIWQSQTTGGYAIISQNANDFIITTYNNIPASNISVPFNNGQLFRVATLDIGDLVKRTINGHYLELVGIAAFRACYFKLGVTFAGPSSMVVQFLDAWDSPEGANQYVYCAQIQANVIAATSFTQQFFRVF